MSKEKNGKIVRLISSIERDIKNLEEPEAEVAELDIHHTHERILGSILHDFYTGVEKIFKVTRDNFAILKCAIREAREEGIKRRLEIAKKEEKRRR